MSMTCLEMRCLLDDSVNAVRKALESVGKPICRYSSAFLRYSYVYSVIDNEFRPGALPKRYSLAVRVSFRNVNGVASIDHHRYRSLAE